MTTRVALRPSGAQGCSHGWSESALRLAQPVDPVREVNPAPEGRRSLPTRASTHEHPKSPSPLPGRAAAPLPLHGFRSPLRGSLHPWLHSGVPSGRSIPARASSPRLHRHGRPLQRGAAHVLRPSPGLRHAGIPVRRPAPGLRGAAPLPSGPVGTRAGRLGASSDSPGERDRPLGARDDSPGRRDRSSVACDNCLGTPSAGLVAWRGRAPEALPSAFPRPLRGVAGGPPPASSDYSRPPSHTSRRRTRQHS
jgi:hypothetical protein